MKCYLVIEHVPYESSYVIFASLDKDLCERFAERATKKKICDLEYHVEEWDLAETLPE